MPTIMIKVRSVLGLVGNYRCFVEGFLNIARPLHYQLKRGIKFEWMDNYEQNFQKLEKRLVSTPILTLLERD